MEAMFVLHVVRDPLNSSSDLSFHSYIMFCNSNSA